MSKTSGFLRYYEGPIVKDIDPTEHRKRANVLNDMMEPVHQIKNGSTMDPNQLANKVLSAYAVHYRESEMEEIHMAFLSLLECTKIDWSTSCCLDA
jgi:hypothetical protein